MTMDRNSISSNVLPNNARPTLMVSNATRIHRIMLPPLISRLMLQGALVPMPLRRPSAKPSQTAVINLYLPHLLALANRPLPFHIRLILPMRWGVLYITLLLWPWLIDSWKGSYCLVVCREQPTFGNCQRSWVWSAYENWETWHFNSKSWHCYSWC